MLVIILKAKTKHQQEDNKNTEKSKPLLRPAGPKQKRPTPFFSHRPTREVRREPSSHEHMIAPSVILLPLLSILKGILSSEGSGICTYEGGEMACRGFLECILKLLNFLLTLTGLAMLGYAIYLFVVFKESTDSDLSGGVPTGNGNEMHKLGRPMLMSVVLSSSFWDDLPKAWFLLVFAELGCAAFIYFDSSWKDVIPTDDTGDFDLIYDFLKEHWTIVKWVALGIVILEALLFLLTLVARATNKPQEYDSDDELINPRQTVRQPLITRPVATAAGVPVAGTLDQRPTRNDAWSVRMREKYGLDTAEFPYNPSEAGRLQQPTAPPVEEKGRCTIM
ncbi:Tobamovirus multiplication protein 2A-like protein [Drosera capensis]